MGHTLRLEPFSGISGDMFLGALAPLLDAEDDIVALPDRLGLAEATVTFEDVVRSTIQCRKATVTVRGAAPEAHSHDPHAGDAHPRGHGHDPHHHAHVHRAYRDIVKQLREAKLAEGVKTRALDLFRLLGEAEASMHGTPLEDVHFHEVGGEDALIDLVGAALLLERLSPDLVFCTPVCVGSGFVATAHGRLPVPAPATQRLLEGMPTFAGTRELEMTTPTGAAILRHLSPKFDPPILTTRHTGMGAGTRDPHGEPNLLRVSLCDPAGPRGETIVLLQTNLDNIPAEDLGADALADLLDAGALDAWLTPVLMKKGRPGHVLEVLCGEDRADRLTMRILSTFPTLGVRRHPGSRTILGRAAAAVATPYGDIAVKAHQLPDGSVRNLPEYESCRDAAIRHGVTTSEVRRAASLSSTAG